MSPSSSLEFRPGPSETIGPKAASSRLAITSATPGGAIGLYHRFGGREVLIVGQPRSRPPAGADPSRLRPAPRVVDVAVHAGEVGSTADGGCRGLQHDIPAQLLSPRQLRRANPETAICAHQVDPVRCPAAPPSPQSVSSRPSGCWARTRLTTRRAACVSTSSIGTAPGS